MQISTRIGILTVLAGVTSMGLLGLVTFLDGRAILENRLADRYVHIAQHRAADTAETLQQAHNDLHLIAEDEFLQQYLANPDSSTPRIKNLILKELEERTNLTGPWHELVFTNTTGDTQLRISQQTDEAVHRLQSGIQRMSTKKVVGHGWDMAEPHYRSGAKNGIVITHAIRISNGLNQQVLGAVVGYLDWNPIQEKLLRVPPHGSAHLVTREGSTLLSSRPSPSPTPEILQNQLLNVFSSRDQSPSHFTGPSPFSGRDSLITIAPVPVKWHTSEFPLFIVFEVPTAIAYEPIHSLAGRIAVVALLLSITMASLVTWAIHRSLAPLNFLASFVRNFWDDRSEELAPLRHRNDEVGILSRHISDLAQNVQERTKALEKSESRFRHQALHDSLTGLPNRAMLMEVMKRSLAQVDRQAGWAAAVFVDLDDFKLINDSLGHSSGDQLLNHVAKRLRRGVRTNDLVARQGGDEFIVFTAIYGHSSSTGSNSAPEHAKEIAQRIMALFETPFVIDGEEIYAKASLGVSLYPEDARDNQELLRNADAAMFLAKQRGKSSYEFFSQELFEGSSRQLKLSSDLHRAIRNDELAVRYQPVVDLQTGDIVSAEALVRWFPAGQEGDPVSPADFIPLAEKTGLIVPIGWKILEMICRDLVRWRGTDIELPVTMNVSARQLLDRELLASILDALQRHQLPNYMVELEITETSMMLDWRRAETLIDEATDAGINIWLDDFGTGYSSLDRLKRMPIQKLKIDQSFVAGIPHDVDDCGIVTATISLGKDLGMECVAEGIEKSEQLAWLIQRGCKLGQGFAFSPAVPADELMSLCRIQPFRRQIKMASATAKGSVTTMTPQQAN